MDPTYIYILNGTSHLNENRKKLEGEKIFYYVNCEKKICGGFYMTREKRNLESKRTLPPPPTHFTLKCHRYLLDFCDQTSTS